MTMSEELSKTVEHEGQTYTIPDDVYAELVELQKKLEQNPPQV